jgi:tetratricopeptide (TPR) repeat protein
MKQRKLAPEERRILALRLSSRGTELLRQGEPHKALPLLIQAYRLQPDHVATAINAAGALLKQALYQEAIVILERARKQEPDNAMIWINLGAAYLGDRSQAGDEEQRQAIAAFERALELDPIAPSVHYNLGLIHRDRGETEQALQRFYQAIQANPLDQHARRAWQRLKDEQEEEN